MPTPLRHLVPALLLLAVAACPGPDAALPTALLPPAADTIIAPYEGEVAGAAWLGGDRWALVSPQDRAVGVADFGTRRLTSLGGARGRELDQPFHLFRAGDSIYVADWQRRRQTAWSLDGKLGGALPAVDAYRGALPRGRDAAGRWYFEIRPVAGRDGRGNLDSASVLRTDLRGAADTVARLAPFDLAEVISEGRRRMERRLLSGQDRWGVLPDGSLWVARVADNRVEWRDSLGAVRSGRQLPDRVLPVTENDRDLFLARFDAGLQPSVSQVPFAAIKPPFENAVTDPSGLLWLVKSRAVGDSVRYYQVVDQGGTLRREVRHAGLGQIIALGATDAIVAEPFEAGVRLLRFRLPPPPPAAALD
jgi:hypothetical protein